MKLKLICLTPVKNEAWVLDLFLYYTSKWADHIIIADQNSVDGSREIASKYSKVILINNSSRNYNEGQRQKLLIDEARKIKGPRILFTLDADEVFSLNFRDTQDWKNILNSQPGDVFGFKWININPDMKTYFTSDFYYPWVVNDDGCIHEQYVKSIHSMRIPFPNSANYGWTHITQFNVLHLNWIHVARTTSKNRYYQCLHFILDSIETPTSLYRSYNNVKRENHDLPVSWICDEQGYLFDKVDLLKTVFWWDQEVINIIMSHGIDRMKYVAIWDDENFNRLLGDLHIEDSRNQTLRLYHYYLKLSQTKSSSYIVKVCDKIINLLVNVKLNNQ